MTLREAFSDATVVGVSLALLIATFLAIPPAPYGDTASYVEAIDVLNGVTPAANFVPNRILTTPLSLTVVRLTGIAFGNLSLAWYLLNACAYLCMLIVWYACMAGLFRSRRAGLWGMILLGMNYIVTAFGPTFLMDIGGWLAFVVGLYMALRCVETGRVSYFYYGAAVAGIGGLFKEYGFLGVFPLAGAIVYTRWGDWGRFLRESVAGALLTLVPVVVCYGYVYAAYGYSYVDWYGHNVATYGASYGSKLIEFVKVFGSLYTFGWFLFLGGLYSLYVMKKDENAQRMFVIIGSLFVAASTVFLWPAITQRICIAPLLFVIVVSCAWVARYERYASYALPLLFVYGVTNLLMDAYILPMFSFDQLFSFI